jgi:hypothetical protein
MYILFGYPASVVVKAKLLPNQESRLWIINHAPYIYVSISKPFAGMGESRVLELSATPSSRPARYLLIAEFN